MHTGNVLYHLAISLPSEMSPDCGQKWGRGGGGVIQLVLENKEADKSGSL